MHWDNSAIRVPWVDYAKGICIAMVVIMHSTLGVEMAMGEQGWMHGLVSFAKPFRMPDFFLIAGLFLARRIDRDWRDYLDRKVIHFAYFYVLWLTIQFLLRAPGLASELGTAGALGQFAIAFVEPFGTLWFIYLLPIFFVVTKTLRHTSPLAIWSLAAAMEIATVDTGFMVVDEFAARFVYFYSGYVLAPHLFRLAEWAGSRPLLALSGLAYWALLNGASVQAGIADWPVVSLCLGFMGASAIVVLSVLLARLNWSGFLRYCGEHSIVIYLAFTVPMAATRLILLKSGLVSDPGHMAVLVTLAALTGPLALYGLVRRTPLAFLFERPGWARLGRGSKTAMAYATARPGAGPSHLLTFARPTRPNP